MESGLFMHTALAQQKPTCKNECCKKCDAACKEKCSKEESKKCDDNKRCSKETAKV